MGWPPSEWDAYIGGFGAPGMTPQAPPVAPPDEWNDGAGPAANAELAQQQQAATRMQVQDAADAALGPEGGAAFWRGTDREAFNASGQVPPSEQKRLYDSKHDRWMTDDSARERAFLNVQNAGVAALGSGSGFTEGVLQGKYSTRNDNPGSLVASNAPRDRAYIAQATGPVGTINQIRDELPFGAIDTPLSREEAQQIELDSPVIEMPDDFVGKSPGLLTPPILGQPDAISGGATAGQQVAEKQVSASGKATAGQTSGKPQMPEEYLDDEEYALAVARKSPEEQALIYSMLKRTRNNHEATRAMEESEKTRRAMESNLRIRDESIKKANQRTAELDVEAKKIADTNPTDSIPAYRKVAGVLAAFIGGFAANKTGRNMGLEVVDQIAQEAAQQQSQRLALIAKQRAGVGEQVATAEDSHRAAEAARLATYDAAIKGLQSEMQKFNPRGALVLELVPTLQQIQAKRGELLVQYQTAQQKREEAALKAMHEQEELKAKIRHDRATEATDRTRAGADWLRAKTDEKKADVEAAQNVLLTPDELRARGVAIPKEANVPAMSLKQARGLAETAKSVEDWNKATRENSPGEQARQLGVENLTTDDGQPLKFKDSGKVAKAFGASTDAVRLYDELIELRKAKGGSTDLMRSPEWRQAHSKFAALLLNQKTKDELGALTGSDLTLESKKIGTEDPTEWRDPLPGLIEGRRNLIEGMNAELRAQAPGQKPKRWDPPLPPDPPAETPDDKAFKALKNWTPAGARLQAPDEFGIDRKDLVTNPGLLDEAFAKNGGLTPSVKEKIDGLYAASVDAASDDEKRRDAAAKLEELGKHAESRVMRDYALRIGANPASGAQVSKD